MSDNRAMNIFRKETRHNNRHETFEQHHERMCIFRRSHELAEHKKYTLVPDIPRKKPQPAAAELQKLLPKLLIIGYTLNLIREKGTVLLPINWQN